MPIFIFNKLSIKTKIKYFIFNKLTNFKNFIINSMYLSDKFPRSDYRFRKQTFTSLHSTSILLSSVAIRNNTYSISIVEIVLCSVITLDTWRSDYSPYSFSLVNVLYIYITRKVLIISLNYHSNFSIMNNDITLFCWYYTADEMTSVSFEITGLKYLKNYDKIGKFKKLFVNLNKYVCWYFHAVLSSCFSFYWDFKRTTEKYRCRIVSEIKTEWQIPLNIEMSQKSRASLIPV